MALLASAESNNSEKRFDQIMFVRPNIHHLSMAAATGCLLLGVASADAGEVPDAGSALKQLQGLGSAPRPALSEQAVIPAPAQNLKVQDVPGPKVRVKRIRFEGNASIEDAVLQEIVKPWTDGDFGFNELSQALDAVSKAYQSAGRVARVFFPQQDVTDGEIRITIVESVMGQVRVLDETRRLDKDWFVNYINRHLPKRGQQFLTPAVEREVRVANEIPGVLAKGSLVAGAQEGETDLALSLEDRPWVSGLLMADNAGQRSSGSERAIAVVNSGISGRGEATMLTLLKTRGVDYAKADIWLTDPWVSGLKLGALTSSMRYRIVWGDQVVNRPRGDAHSWGVQATYALDRQQQSELTWRGTLERKSLYNEHAGQAVSDYSVTVMTQQLSGFFADGWLQGGVNSYVLSLTAGRVALSGSPNQADDAASARTQGGYSKWTYGLTRLQDLSDGWRLTTGWSGQWAQQNLDSSEKFYIGGSSSVRAYPASEAGGDRGYQFTVDIKRRWSPGTTLGGFYDYGHVKVSAHPWDGAANNLTLRGYGFSAQWQPLASTQLKALLAWRHGRNPNPTPNGNDQDGTMKNPRLWLEAIHSF